jgi:tetratricopeptide (TPR) repeat protein
LLAVIGEGTSGFWVKAALQRAQLLQSKWAHTDDVALLDEAKVLLERASLRAAASGPLLHARLLGELCDVASQLGAERSEVETMARAVRTCEDALALPIAGGSLEPYVRHAYGVALGRMGHARRDAATVKRGVEQLALAVGTAHRAQAPSFRTTAWANYGWGLRALAQFEDAEENLRQAANASGLAADARRVAPVRWARIKEGEAKALLALGSLQRSRFQMAAAQKLYQQSRSSFGEALTVFTKAEAPKRWARLEEHIGETLAREGEVGDHQLFAQALQEYQRALTINRRESDPAAFARTQFGLGVTYLFWADQGRGLERIRRVAKQSVAAFRAALKVHQELGLVDEVANDQAHLADALFILNRVNRAPDCEPLELLLQAIRADPQARGLWEPAAASLARFDPSKFDASKCPNVDVAFWKETASRGPWER